MPGSFPVAFAGAFEKYLDEFYKNVDPGTRCVAFAQSNVVDFTEETISIKACGISERLDPLHEWVAGSS